MQFFYSLISIGLKPKPVKHYNGFQPKKCPLSLIFRNTVEEKLLELQSRKRKLAGDLVGEDEAVAKNLTKEDVAYLFS